MDGGRKDDIALHRRWQRPDQRDAFRRLYLADVEQADLDVALGDQRGSAVDREHVGELRLDGIGDAHLGHHACERDTGKAAAGRIGMDDHRASRSILRTAATVEMSGRGVLSRTMTPMPTRASSTRPGRNVPAFSSVSMIGAGRTTMSGVSPLLSLAWISAGVATVNAI